MMNDEDSNMAANGICHAATMAGDAWQAVAYSFERPSVLYRPRLYPDGNMWCAFYGEDLQSGLAGFGETPAKAMEAFDKAWNENNLPNRI